MKLEEVFDKQDFAESELERLKHELAVIKCVQCEQTIVKTIEEIKAIPPDKEFYICGAANCSFLLYALGVTKVDPLRFDLPFERFVNPLRNDTAPVIQPEFVSKTHIKTDLTIDGVVMSLAFEEKQETKAIPMSSYKNQPLYDILYETRGKLLWQEQFINVLNRVGGMLPEYADAARRDICKYGKDSMNCDIYYDWLADHAERLGYDGFEMSDYVCEFFENIRYAKCKAHFLAQAIHNYEFVQTPNPKHTAVICFGEAYHIAKHILPEKVASYRCYDTRLELKKAISDDKDLCMSSGNGMSKEDFIICTDVTKGLRIGNNEDLAKDAVKAIEKELEKYIRSLKLNGVKKVIVIAYSGTFEYYATELIHTICKKENVPCDIYAYHIGKDIFPDMSLQEKRIFDLQKNCGAEILLYPHIGGEYYSESFLGDIDKQYAKTIEYTCL